MSGPYGYKTPRRDQSEMVRIPWRISKGLAELLMKMADKHIPPPTRTIFFELIITLGIEAYKAKTPLREQKTFRSKKKNMPYRLSYMFKETIFLELSELASTMSPPVVTRRVFFEYILNLGVQRYYEEYTIYGFKK